MREHRRRTRSRGGGMSKVGLIMGSDSDWPVMSGAAEALEEFGVGYEARVVSAHRMPRDMLEYAETAAERGLQVIIAGAGGAAHLPGMVASATPLPVIGVPVPLKYLDGLARRWRFCRMPAALRGGRSWLAAPATPGWLRWRTSPSAVRPCPPRCRRT